MPRLDQFTVTSEAQGLPVDAIPAPVPSQPGEQTLRIAIPWPAPAPHAPLYMWRRGEDTVRKTAVVE